ncbi:hypothetical protein SNOG_07852 [Parastagonospora nodorum SN15]|uniref:Uncharacterized protein n=1 Tax=Phaeosphaeria nodorum (strain SN15 / ATCC MYA-4574 / FGSC 10173) TaxID=321614 RepID=Q0UK62_PHANO|nr:hypothetical protein SNOG_07852 [Parastagonospora nodorum SN15]EAT85318.2 hypothetical protein SNOG_07852 [Parastagonospora nodorum SN15]
MSASSVQQIDLRIMNGTQDVRGSNVPFAFNPGGNTSVAVGARPSSTIPQDRLIVGVDFGTTYSGVAAVYSASPEDIDIIKTWPGGNGITSDKVPTEIGYSEATTQSGSTSSLETFTRPAQTIKWGFQFKPEETRLRCVKLFLDRNQKLPCFVSPLETAAQLRKYEKTVMEAVSDYLAQIYKHTMETLTRRYGQAFMGMTMVQFVLTVPAVWSDSAKDATLKAAEKAGMGKRHELQLISEPEAAAVYTLKAIQPNYLKIGDNFIVCDAGGGTVDLIAYKILQLNPLRVEESAVGTGGLCGSAFLNYRFEDHVKLRIGTERYNWMREKKQKTWDMGLKYFEEFVKRNFNEEEHAEVNIPLPGLPDDEEAGLDSGFLIMSAEQVKEIFDPVVEQVISLVEGQVESIRQKGGLVASGRAITCTAGSSRTSIRRPPPPYTERPTHAAALSAPQSVEIYHPIHAWTAVVRGAVLRGLEGSMVVSRRSRWHYGTSYATVFDEAKHPISDRYWSPLWERWMGAQVSETTPISFHYTRNFRPGQSLIVEDDLIACDAEVAPDSFRKGLTNVCTLTTDLNTVPKSLFTRLTTTKGVEFDNLDFTLDMRIASAGLVFELKVDGVRYGSVEAKFH